MYTCRWSGIGGSGLDVVGHDIYPFLCGVSRVCGSSVSV
jgi:hypothetical protein